MPERSHAAAVYVRRHDDVTAERMHYRAFLREIPRHFHDQYQISVCVGGHGTYRYEASAAQSRSGDLQLFAPGVVHTYEHGDTAERGSVYRSLYLDPATVARALAELHDGATIDVLPSAVLPAPEVLAGFVRLHDAYLLGASALERDGQLLDFLGAVLDRHPDVRAGSPRVGNEQRAVRRVEAFLRAHSERNVRLEELSAVAGLSQWRIHRAFSSAVGIPPHAYQMQLRVARARALLAQGVPIADVAIETGFADQAHLTRVFKRLVGITPGRYAEGGKNVQDLPDARAHVEP